MSDLTEFCWLSTSDPDWPSINESERWVRTSVSRIFGAERLYLFVHIPPAPKVKP